MTKRHTLLLALTLLTTQSCSTLPLYDDGKPGISTEDILWNAGILAATGLVAQQAYGLYQDERYYDKRRKIRRGR